VKVKGTDTGISRKTDYQESKVSDFDDLVFENRNREYGAYQLRKRYNSVLLTGLVIAVLLVTIAVLIPFLARPDSERVVMVGAGFGPVRLENLEQPKEFYVPPAAPPPQPAKIQEAVKYVPPVVVDTLVPLELALLSTDEIISSPEGEIMDSNELGFGDGLIDGMGDGSMEEPLFQVEVMPTFKGGDLTKFREWVAKRTNYPQAAIDNRIRGTVFLTFIVEKDGAVTNVTVTKGVHPLLDEEAIKAISESPKWSPGLQRGQPVRVRFLIPLSFMN